MCLPKAQSQCVRRETAPCVLVVVANTAAVCASVLMRSLTSHFPPAANSCSCCDDIGGLPPNLRLGPFSHGTGISIHYVNRTPPFFECRQLCTLHAPALTQSNVRWACLHEAMHPRALAANFQPLEVWRPRRSGGGVKAAPITAGYCSSCCSCSVKGGGGGRQEALLATTADLVVRF